MKYLILLFILIGFIFSCKSKKEQAMFYVDQNWIEVHFKKSMTTKELVDIRERLAPLGVILSFVIIQRDSANNLSMLQIDVQDGKGKIARSRTEFLDEIPYGIRIRRSDYTDEGFKVGPLYTKRPE